MLPKLTSPNQANSFSTHHFASNPTSSLTPVVVDSLKEGIGDWRIATGRRLRLATGDWRMLNFQGELPFAPTIRHSLPFLSWLIATPTIRHSLFAIHCHFPTCRLADLTICR
jgi:hypothetical protein